MKPALDPRDRSGGQLGDVDAISNRYDLYDYGRRLVLRYAYRSFGVLTMPAESDTSLADHIIISNWPEAFVREYDECGLMANSRSFAAMRKSVRPLTWDVACDGSRRKAGGRDRGAEIFQRYGVPNGILLPVHDVTGTRGVVSLGGERPAPEQAEISDLALLCTGFFERARAIMRTSAEAGIRITERERQCLVWISAGKTSSEIGAILALSEHTVNQYITSCCQKLGTVNRAQAVAKAIRLKLID